MCVAISRVVSPDPTQRVSNCSKHFARLPIESEYALSPCPLLPSRGSVGQSRQNVQDCHEPGYVVLPSTVEDLLRLEFRQIDSAPPNFANAKLQSKRDRVRISTSVIAVPMQVFLMSIHPLAL